jgi:hypothetical protein
VRATPAARARRTPLRAGALRRALPTGLVLAGLATGLSGCAGSGSAVHEQSAADVVATLGAVPIPTAGPAESTPSASAGHPAVLAMGGPVRVLLPGGTDLLATALGPLQAASGAPTSGPHGVVGAATSTAATISLRLNASRGSVRVAADELSSRDDTGRLVPLKVVGATSAVAAPGAPAQLTLAGRYHSGSGQVTWRHAGHVLAVWTFTIELD